ncbi:hypothetical protein [Clostridium sp. AM58-1XD]|uniref:hypothetical protein n=1 Tax=Clostridium sp. AM58-1XD TaxID=2292307 RepID=UPI000E514487|nr:hypothetical protein [Clostridium sp. AM58-1XD]RGY95163.1 hypothetical protein DXA13_19750 [Clostridium sp. AM58-1XD]
MLEIPEKVKQRCREDNSRTETVKHLELSFFSGQVDALYPSNELFPTDQGLYPSDAGDPWLTINMDRICAESLSLSESLCSGDHLIWGSCEAAKVEITVADVEDEMIGKEFAATLTVGDYQMASAFTQSTVWNVRQIGENVR